MSDAEESLATLLKWEGLPTPSREYHFLPGRRYRFDFAWWERKLAVEVEGGSWIAGHHNRGKGFEDDCRKYGEAALMGWTVLRVTPRMVEDGTVIAWLKRVLA